jgi:hypothetical protein
LSVKITGNGSSRTGLSKIISSHLFYMGGGHDGFNSIQSKALVKGGHNTIEYCSLFFSNTLSTSHTLVAKYGSTASIEFG